MNTVRIGVIGCGGRVRGILRRLLDASHGRIVITAACDPSTESLQVLREKTGYEIATEPTVESLVRRPDIDWVVIGSWNCFHAGQAIAALHAGKHVFCEKPLATNMADCLAIQQAVEKSGRTFAFGLVLRYSPFYQKVHELISGGRIGQIISFEFNETLGFNHGGYIFGNWRRSAANAGSHLLEKCCHDLDLANWIIGSRPVRVASFGGHDFFLPHNAPHADRVGPDHLGRAAYATWADPNRVSPFSDGADIVDNQVAILEYANGVRGTFHTNCHAAIPERRFSISGSEGGLRADAMTGLIELRRIGHESVTEKIDLGIEGGHAGGDEIMAESLAATLLEGKPPLASVAEGIESAAVAFAIDEAMRESRIVTINW